MLSKLLLLLPLVVLVALVALARRHPMVAWLTLAGLVIAAGDWTNPGALMNVGGLAIYPQDATAIVLLVAVFTTPGVLKRAEPADLALWGMVAALVLISLVRGFSEFGAATAGNEVRAIVQLAAATLWVWTRMPLPQFSRELRRWCWVTALGLTVVVSIHIWHRGLGNVDELILVNGDEVTSRPLVATQALILGLIGLALLVRETRFTLRLVAVGFLTLCALCQQRSVWAALILAVASLALLAPKLRARLFGLGLLTGLVVLVLYSAGTLDPLIHKFELAYHSRGTFVDRQLAWRTLVGQQNQMGSTTVLLGQPFGSGYVRREPNGTIEYFAPHNYYVSLYLRIGLIGVTAFVLAMGRGVWRNLKSRQAVGVAWAVGLMTFCYAYNIQLYVAPLLAVAIGVTLAPSAGDQESTPPQPDDVRSGVVAVP
ncbi:MAG TPA: hypothetical protein VGK78_08820 [Nocardioides sp.]|uniref:hypothetical protein n=1 Tax=Nocardioides sp. TaxID=35761 RepID=UPI002F3F3620